MKSIYTVLQLIFLILFSFFNTGCKKSKVEISPTTETLVESVYGSAALYPKNGYYINATVSGILMKKNVFEGDTFLKNQVLFEIENTSSDLQSTSAKSNLQLAEENLEGKRNVLFELEQRLKASQSKLTLDSINFLRQKSLWEKNIGSKNDYDMRKLTYEMSASDFIALTSKYQQTKSLLKSQLTNAKSNFLLSNCLVS